MSAKKSKKTLEDFLTSKLTPSQTNHVKGGNGTGDTSQPD